MHAENNGARCPLCGNRDTALFHEDRLRVYLQCAECRLVFVPERFWLSPEEERAEYDLHENDAGDPGYRRFLSRLSEPLLKRLEPGGKGLDFGCGPGPALPAMLEEQGHRMDLYDPIYRNDLSVFRNTYDFISATEVVEHLKDPDEAFSSLFAMLRPGGWLGVMTKLVIDRKAFEGWHYIRDKTHICFYSRKAFAYIAERFDAALQFAADDVILFRKTR